MTNWNKEPDEKKIYRLTKFCHKLDNNKCNAHERTCKKTEVYIYLYISLYENLFENGCIYIYICYSPAGRSGGETVPEVLNTARGRWPRAVLRPRTQFLPIRTDLGRWITFLVFFFSKILKSQENFPPLYNLCVLKCDAFVLMKGAIDCKPKQNVTTRFLAR